MWHQHIEKAIKNLGYESMIEWPSVYFEGFGATLILIVLYVDDLLIAAAKELAHRALTELREYIQIGEHSDISKYLGCNHHLDTENGISRCRFDMRAYLKAAYNDFTKRANTKPKPSAIPPTHRSSRRRSPMSSSRAPASTPRTRRTTSCV